MAQQTVPQWLPEAVKLYEAGASILQVSDQVGVSRATVWRWLTRSGVPIRASGRGKASAQTETGRQRDRRESFEPRTLTAFLAQLTADQRRALGRWLLDDPPMDAASSRAL